MTTDARSARVPKGAAGTFNVGFLDHSLHFTTTLSSRFFTRLLESWFGTVTVIDLSRLWDEVPKKRWDILVVWQHQYPPRVLESLGCDNVVLVPMYDDCPKDREYWVQYAGFKILCFSSTLADLLEPWGLQVHRVTYRPEVPNSRVSFEHGLRGFFWPRTTELDWRQVGPLARAADWTSFHLHRALTPPEVTLPPEGEFPDGVLAESQWFEKAEDFASVMERSNVFFAPRRFEGIGMAVLEALALGQCVIAPNFPTANEYIVNGVSGFLFDPDSPVAPDYSQARAWGAEARTQALAGRRAWEAGLPELRAFLETTPDQPRTRFHPWIVLRGRAGAFLRSLVQGVKGRPR